MKVRNQRNSKYSEKRISFLKILRCIEAEIDRETTHRDGIKAEVGGLKGALSEFNALRKRLYRETERLRSQSEDTSARRTRIETELKSQGEQLYQWTEDIGELEDECEEAKEKVKKGSPNSDSEYWT